MTMWTCWHDKTLKERYEIFNLKIYSVSHFSGLVFLAANVPTNPPINAGIIANIL